MHAIDYMRTDLANRIDLDEMYFQLEPISEIGYSYEKAVSHLMSITSGELT